MISEPELMLIAGASTFSKGNNIYQKARYSYKLNQQTKSQVWFLAAMIIEQLFITIMVTKPLAALARLLSIKKCANIAWHWRD